MSHSPVRLALIGTKNSTSGWAEAAKRLQNVQTSFVAESVEKALSHEDDFDALILDSSADTLYAAKCGKHILINVPFADSIDEAHSLLEACHYSGIYVAAGPLLFHSPANQTVINQLKSGKLGVPGLLRVHRWSCQPSQSFSILIYGDIDLAIRIFSTPPITVYAINRENYCQVHLGFPNGGMAVLDFSGCLPHGEDYDFLSLVGSKGTAYADDHHNTHLLYAGGNPAALISDAGNGYLQGLQSFIDGIVHQSDSSTERTSILTNHSVIEAVKRSMKSAQVLQENGGVYELA